MKFISHSSYQKLIKPSAVKWCGICKQLKNKLLKLYSANDLAMASVDTELIPSLRDEFEIRAGKANSRANFHQRRKMVLVHVFGIIFWNQNSNKVPFMEWNLFQHCYYLMDRISFYRFLQANFLLSNKWLCYWQQIRRLQKVNHNVNTNVYTQISFNRSCYFRFLLNIQWEEVIVIVWNNYVEWYHEPLVSASKVTLLSLFRSSK